MPKIQINWANIDQVITLCCKKVIYHLPRTVLFKIFRNQLHFQNVLQQTTACKTFKTSRCGSSSAILFLVEKKTYVCEHEVWTSRSQLSQARAWVRPGYEVDNSRVKLHQPRPQDAFQKKKNKTMASNSRYDSFFFSFLIGYRCMIITSSRLIFV